MNSALPPLAWPLGLAGLLPFTAGLAGMAMGVGWAGPALAGYGAVILAFLGGVHWGLALHAPGQADRLRLVGGVLPSLVAWVALLLPTGLGLVVLGLGLLGLVAAESWAARRGLLPWAYLRLRWVLSLVAAACLLGGAALIG